MRLSTALLVSVLLPSPALAQQPVKASAPAAAPKKDPSGVTGVSPFWELLLQGDAAATARDFDSAIRLYGEAIAASPKNPLGHYRLGQAQVLKGSLADAELAYSAALQTADARTDPEGNVRAKVLFCIADLHERRKATEQAIAAWTEYDAHAKSHPKAKVHLTSSADRRERNTAWKKNLADAAEVKRRIESAKNGAKR